MNKKAAGGLFLLVAFAGLFLKVHKPPPLKVKMEEALCPSFPLSPLEAKSFASNQTRSVALSPPEEDNSPLPKEMSLEDLLWEQQREVRAKYPFLEESHPISKLFLIHGLQKRLRTMSSFKAEKEAELSLLEMRKEMKHLNESDLRDMGAFLDDIPDAQERIELLELTSQVQANPAPLRQLMEDEIRHELDQAQLERLVYDYNSLPQMDSYARINFFNLGLAYQRNPSNLLALKRLVENERKFMKGQYETPESGAEVAQ